MILLLQCRKILYSEDDAQTGYKISTLQYFKELADKTLRNLTLH